MPMNENTYNEILKCYNHQPATVGRGWNQDETLTDTCLLYTSDAADE